MVEDGPPGELEKKQTLAAQLAITAKLPAKCEQYGDAESITRISTSPALRVN